MSQLFCAYNDYFLLKYLITKYLIMSSDLSVILSSENLMIVDNTEHNNGVDLLFKFLKIVF